MQQHAWEGITTCQYMHALHITVVIGWKLDWHSNAGSSLPAKCLRHSKVFFVHVGSMVVPLNEFLSLAPDNISQQLYKHARGLPASSPQCPRSPPRILASWARRWGRRPACTGMQTQLEGGGLLRWWPGNYLARLTGPLPALLCAVLNACLNPRGWECGTSLLRSLLLCVFLC